MKRRGFIIYSILVLTVIVSSALFVSPALVYDAVITHPGLTKEAAELYNKENNLKLTTEEIGYLALGAIEEDAPIRWMNHFYDPVHNIGLANMYDSAKKWSTDEENQINYAKGNNTWQDAIYNYQTGNKKQAFISLGHVLHLLEDMTVPAHTRDDAHPEGDPYEHWVRNNFKQTPANTIYYNSLNKYFDYLANYSNNNFYSKDTIETNNFKFLKISKAMVQKADDGLFYEYEYYKNFENIEYPLFFKGTSLWNNFLPTSNQVFEKKVEDPLILSSHFSLLAPKAIGAGAGVIKLFFEETQKQQNYKPPFWKTTPVGIVQENLGRFVSLVGNIKDKFTDQFSSLIKAAKEMTVHYGEIQTNINFIVELWKTHDVLAQGITDINNGIQDVQNLPDKIVQDVAQEIVQDTTKSIFTPQPKPVPNNNVPTEIQSAPENPKNQILELLPQVTAPTHVLPSLATKNSSPTPTRSNPITYYSGGGVGNSGSSNPVSNNLVQQDAITQTSSTISTDITTEVITPTSTASSTTIIIDNQTNSTSSTATTTPIIVDNSADNTTSTFANTSSTPVIFATSTPSSTSTVEVVAGANSTSTVTVATSTMDIAPRVVINEIAWGGNEASYNDEWMELYNNSDFAVDLTGWTLTDGNDININFSSSTVTKIPAYGFYLLERTSDNTITNRIADYVYTGALKDSGEKIELKNKQGIVMDFVDCRNNWFAGRNAYDKESMERVDVATTGNVASNWKSSMRPASSGRDAKNNIIVGTPNRVNSTITYLTGTLNNNRTLTAENSPYFLDYFTIASGTVLTINPGVTLIGGRSSMINVYGKLESLGTADKPVIFTSYNDPIYKDVYGSVDRNWSQIRMYPGSTLNLTYANLLNGNSNTDAQKPKSLIYADRAVVNLDNVDIKGSKEMGDRYLAQFVDANFTVSNSNFHDSMYGIKIVGGNGKISGSVIENIDIKAIDSTDCQQILLEKNTFKNTGWGYLTSGPGLTISSVSFQGYFPQLKNNVWDNNMVNAPDWTGTVKSSGTLDFAIEQPLVIQTLTIPAGVVLTIPQSSILKMVKRVTIYVKGSLNVLGTQTNPVVFTSIRDDESGGNTNVGDNMSLDPEGNEWSQLSFDQSGTSTLNYLTLKYANDTVMPQASIYVNKSFVIFDHLNLLNTRMPGDAIQLKDANEVIIKNSLIKNLTKRDIKTLSITPSGIYVRGGTPYLDNITVDTYNYGIFVDYGTKPQFGPDGMTYNNVDIDSFGLPNPVVDLPE